MSMSDHLPAGPYRTITAPDGTAFPYYIIPFDKKGRCEGPETLRHLLDHCGDRSDIYLFSHGWNNDWKAATDRYESFISGFMQMRKESQLAPPANYAPLLVGIFWPSTALVKDSEEAPGFAGEEGVDDVAIAEERQTVREVAEVLDDSKVARFYDLTQREELGREDALELAEMVCPLFRSDAGEGSGGAAASAEEVVRIWQAMAPETEDVVDLDEVQTASSPAGTLQAAGGIGDFFKSILPRDVIRTLTVWQMKDRAGTVGTNGVSPLLAGLLTRSAARVHLIGHSYGGKVVLSALCAAPLTRKICSVLLLQPAVSHLCFAAKVDGANRPGGYRAALQRVERPIASTFSEHDFPLTKVFHKALRRDDDLGELRTAAFPDPPNRYAALGGFGPRGAGEKLIPILDPLQGYQFDPAIPIYGINGTRGIEGHGDISNKWTWWLLHNQVVE
jgi:hypothetical protein